MEQCVQCKEQISFLFFCSNKEPGPPGQNKEHQSTAIAQINLNSNTKRETTVEWVLKVQPSNIISRLH